MIPTIVYTKRCIICRRPSFNRLSKARENNLAVNPILLIPARMSATRLPGKPLAMIGGDPMIVHVWRRAVESGVGEVAVACGDQEIADAITKVGGRAVMTDPGLPSGSDRIWQALGTLDPQRKHDVIINLQGDMPTLNPAIMQSALALLNNPEVDIGTLAAVIVDENEKKDPAVVKVTIDGQGRALSFSRATVPSGDGLFYHHIGLYAYKRHALQKFVSLPPSVLEKREKLEQLRALEAGMRIDVAIVETVPLGVDTPETLEKARNLLCH
jgi:3-deoxy-manno-octulosonate cytidylyltransferase (CMP-KDO synthetase)